MVLWANGILVGNMDAPAPEGGERSGWAPDKQKVRKGPLSHEQAQGWGGGARGTGANPPSVPWDDNVLGHIHPHVPTIKGANSPTASGNRSHIARGFWMRVGGLFCVPASVPHTLLLNPDQQSYRGALFLSNHPLLPSLHGSLNQALLGQPLHAKFNDEGEITLTKCVHSSPH